MGIEVRHLRYFVAVAEEGSFTAAARRVHITQQVLSAQMQQLEGILGVRLLERSSRGASVTAAGATFLDGARSTLAELDRAASAARNSALAIQGVLPVGLNVAAAGELPTRLLAAFRREEPAVEIRLHSSELTQPAGGLLDRSTDVAFVRPPIRAAGIELATLADEPRVWVLPAGHPLAGRDRLHLSDTETLPWIAAPLATDGCDPAAWRDDWLVSPRPSGGGRSSGPPPARSTSGASTWSPGGASACAPRRPRRSTPGRGWRSCRAGGCPGRGSAWPGAPGTPARPCTASSRSRSRPREPRMLGPPAAAPVPPAAAPGPRVEGWLFVMAPVWSGPAPRDLV